MLGLAATPDADPFPTPPGLREAVDFWARVFAVWRRDQVVLHDNEHLGLVYEIVDLPGASGDSLSAEQQAQVRARQHNLERELRELERRVRLGMLADTRQQGLLDRLISTAGKAALRGASARVNRQRGMRERFLAGLERSGHYDAHIRRVFKAARMPEDLAYLPHVESSFVNHARSSAGAVGVWQFMPATGRRCLRMHAAVDERYDPVLAARGAVRYLEDAYQYLGDWPLAITSYNHGVGGMLRAKEQFGTDIERIVRYYRGPAFGYASRNFYAEFLGVRRIMGQLSHYFPEGVRFYPPLDQELVRLARPTRADQLARKCAVNHYTLASMNPAWTSAAVNGSVPLPGGSDVWLPKGSAVKVAQESGYGQTVAWTDYAALLEPVRQGEGWDTLSDTREYIPTVYPPRPTVKKHAGRARARGEPRAGAAKSQSVRHAGWKTRGQRYQALFHVVRKGESIRYIAAKYKIKPSKLLAANDLKPRGAIRPGQRLRIPVRVL